MSRIKYLPMIVVGMSIALFFIAFAPLVGILTGVGLSSGLAHLIAALLVLTPTMFILGLNARKRVFGLLLFIIIGVILISFFVGGL